MKINTCYTVKIQKQLTVDTSNKQFIINGSSKVDSLLMKQTSDICLAALKSVYNSSLAA